MPSSDYEKECYLKTTLNQPVMRMQFTPFRLDNFSESIQSFLPNLAIVFSRAARGSKPRPAIEHPRRGNAGEHLPKGPNDCSGQATASKDWQKGIENLEENLFRPLSYYLDGYKIHEIAEYLDQSPSVIREKINEAKSILKRDNYTGVS